MLNSIGNGVISVDNRGVIINMNHVAEDLCGWPLTEALGKPLTEVFQVTEAIADEPDDDPVKKAGKVYKAAGLPIYSLLRSRDCSEYKIAKNTVPVSGLDGTSAGAVLIFRDITTEYVQAKKLALSEERLNLAMAIKNEGIWDWNLISNETYFDDRYYTMAGYQPDEFPQNFIAWAERVHPEDLSAAQNAIKEYLAGKMDVFDVEFRFCCKDGSWKWIRGRGKIVEWDAQGNPLRMIGTHADITDRKHAEEALRKSEERYRKIFESNMIGIGFWGADGRIYEANDVYLSIIHSSRQEFDNQQINWKELTPAEHLPTDAQAIEEILTKGFCATYEKEYLLKDGSRVPVLIGGALISRNPVIGIAFALDISEQKQAEKSLRESEGKYRSIVENISDALYVHDFSGMIIDINQNVCRMTGYSRDELVGAHLSKIDHIDHLDSKNTLAATIEKLIEKGNLLFESEHIAKDGKAIPVQISGKIVSAEGHGIVYQLVRDITDILLQKKVLDNFQKLEALGVLAGGIAHDFNNLMGGIFGQIDMALDQSTDTVVSNHLEKAMSAIDRARSLTQQLLTFAKGGSPIRKVGHLFPFIEETARFALSGSNVLCRFFVPENLWLCNFDKNQIGQVFDNLIINAQQAMPLGGTIEITAQNIFVAENEQPLLSQGKFIKISVRDTGIGIPKKLLSKIFDPFFTTKSKGHGLGLATCYSIVNRHNGTIEVDSDLDKGSVFSVYLPAAEGGHAEISEKPIIKHHGNGMILVMDDEEIMRTTMEAMLESLGYTAVCKNNGQAAIDFFLNESKDIKPFVGMIFDLTVPGGMGGKEAAAEIRKTDREIPIFVASGYAGDPVMRNPAEFGFTASICKPFRLIELEEMLEKHLKINQ
jgi:PAS domain S-box-containing protein